MKTYVVVTACHQSSFPSPGPNLASDHPKLVFHPKGHWCVVNDRSGGCPLVYLRYLWPQRACVRILFTSRRLVKHLSGTRNLVFVSRHSGGTDEGGPWKWTSPNLISSELSGSNLSVRRLEVEDESSRSSASSELSSGLLPPLIAITRLEVDDNSKSSWTAKASYWVCKWVESGDLPFWAQGTKETHWGQRT